MPGLDDPPGPPRGGPARASAAGGHDGRARAIAVNEEAGGGDGGPRAPEGNAQRPLHTSPIERDQPKKLPPPAAPPPKVNVHSDDPMIGTIIAGRYRVDARLGEGGMGAVYRVEHLHMRKKLALKVLHREMTTQTEIVARFEREAMAAAHIEHPNVAGATDFGKLEDGTFFLVLEYVEGTSLRTVIDKGPMAPHRAVHVTVQMLAALRRAHELGIVHRDLKPENVLLVDKDGDPDFAKVLDFGIARVPIGSLVSGGESGPSLTRAGMVYGTPEYMAPEQALGQAVDGRSDIYGTGVMLFEMLTGRRPYDNKDKVALLGQHVAGPIPSLRERAPALNLPAELEVVVTKLLQKSPSDRYQDASEAVEALLDVPLEGGPLMLMSRTPSGRSGFMRDAERSGDYPATGSGRIRIVPTSGAVAAITQERAFQTSATEAPPSMELSRARDRSKMQALIGVAGAAVAIIVLAIWLVGRSGAKTNTDDEGDRKHAVASASTSASSSSTAAPLSDDEAKALADKALARVDAGDAQGLADLEALAADHDGNPPILVDLAKAYSKSKRHVEAIGALKRLVTASPQSASDPAIGPIVDAALPTNADTVFTLLAGPMGSEGTPILFDIGYGNRGPSGVRKRARDVLSEPEVAKSMMPSIAAAIEFMKANGCDQKKTVLERFRKDLDARILPYLRPLTATRGCGGFFKNQDCWPCLHKDKYLDGLIKEIDARTKASKQP